MVTYRDFFRAATGHEPYRYQRRLAEEYPSLQLLKMPDIRDPKSAIRN